MKKGLFGAVRPGESAADRLRMTPEYRRFDQKENMIYAGEWNEAYKGLSDRDWFQGRVKMMGRNVSGYRREDWAFLMGATAGTSGADFVINIGDSGGTSWSPMKRSTVGGEPMTNLPPWEGSEAENTRLLKKMALRFGAGDVGVCKLDRRFVYSRYFDTKTNESYPIRFSEEPGFEQYTEPGTLPDGTRVIPKEMDNVLVLVYPMELSGIRAALKMTHMATTLETYSTIAFTSMALAEFIRGLGYRAIPSSNDTASNIPLAIDAGLGEAARSSKLCHPEYGTCCRISKIITDMPLTPDRPITFGVYDFCKSCGRCAEKCPAKAIPMEGEVSDKPFGAFSPSHVTQWQIDHAKCRKIWVTSGTNCGICIAACPLNQENTLAHRLRKSAAAKWPGLNRRILKAMLRAGGGQLQKPEDFWANL